MVLVLLTTLIPFCLLSGNSLCEILIFPFNRYPEWNLTHPYSFNCWCRCTPYRFGADRCSQRSSYLARNRNLNNSLGSANETPLLFLYNLLNWIQNLMFCVLSVCALVCLYLKNFQKGGFKTYPEVSSFVFIPSLFFNFFIYTMFYSHQTVLSFH